MLLASFCFAESPLTFTVGTNSVKVDVDRDKHQTIPTAWVSASTNTQGSVVLWGPEISIDGHDVPSKGSIYMTYTNMVSGTNGPTHIVGISGSFVYINTGSDQRPVERKGISIVLLTSNAALSVSVGTTAEIGKGEVLTHYGSSWTLDPVSQDPIYCVANKAGVVISLQRW
jgi:hypothetical protein